MAHLQENILPNPVVADVGATSMSVRAGAIEGRFLFHPLIDFLCLGGGSLIALALMWFSFVI